MSADGAAIRIGVDSAPPPPMCFGVPGEAAFEGFEIDLLGALGTRLGRPLTYTASLWADLLAGLDTGALDLVCTAVTITPEREGRLLFGEPYLRTALAIICRRDRPAGSLDRVAGVIGARVNTPAEKAALAASARVSTFHFNTDVYRALEDGTLDAVVDDLPIGAWFAAQSPALMVGGRVRGSAAQYGLAFAPGQDGLRRACDAAFGDLVADGTYARLYDRWMAPFVGDACDVRVARSERPA